MNQSKTNSHDRADTPTHDTDRVRRLQSPVLCRLAGWVELLSTLMRADLAAGATRLDASEEQFTHVSGARSPGSLKLLPRLQAHIDQYDLQADPFTSYRHGWLVEHCDLGQERCPTCAGAGIAASMGDAHAFVSALSALHRAPDGTVTLLLLLRVDFAPPFTLQDARWLDRLLRDTPLTIHEQLWNERSRATNGTARSAFSRTESRIIALLKDGLNAREIAEQLDRSVHTVHTHTRNIYRKVGVHNRRELLERVG